MVVAHSHLTVGPLQQATRTVPIVFVQVLDPVGAGVVANLARPGGNITGFSSFEYPMSSKWLELLKEVAPKTAKAVVLTHSAFASGPAQLQVVRSVAPSLGLEVEPIDVQDAAAIEPALAGIAREANVGMVVTTSTFATLHRELIVGLAARYRLPAVYPYRYYAAAGGLLSYGIDVLDLYRRAASTAERKLGTYFGLAGERFCFHGPAEGLGHGLVEIGDELLDLGAQRFLAGEIAATEDLCARIENQISI